MYTVPKQKQMNFYEVGEFKGIDFTTSPIEVDAQRSPYAVNIVNNDGYMEKRNGYHVLNKIGSCINGVWNIDTTNGEMFLVHTNQSLYQVSSDFQTSVLMLTGMKNERSKGIYFKDYLLIFDGNRTVVFSKFDGTNYEAKFLDQIGYVPTISVGRDSKGSGKDYEERNLMSPYAVNTFYAEKIQNGYDSEGNPIYVDQDTFILSENNIDSVEVVEKLNSNAEWERITNYTADLAKGEIKFVPGESPVIGTDNVRVLYKKELNQYDKINKCNIAEMYGYEGNNDRIFVTGNPELANYDYWCEQDNPLYWPDSNFAKIGVEPILGYSKLSDGSLAILKKHSDTDNTVYYRSYNIINNIEVFPLKDGVKNIGCVSKYAIANLVNDPLFLSEQGVFALIGDNGEKYAMQRSYYANGKLTKENNLEEAIGIAVNGKYYIGINNHVYIADSRYYSYPRHSKTEQYQYEWYYWENIPARVFFSWENRLYFGTNEGEICEFTDDYLDIDKPVEAIWETPFLDLGTNQYAKTIKNVLLILNPKRKSSITFAYELDDGEQEIITKIYQNLTDNFPKTIFEKEKISKFMFIKFIMKDDTENRMSFERVGCEWKVAGKYKGE